MGPTLIIGATGLVGRALLEQMRADGHETLGTSRDGNRADLACDLRDAASVEAALEQAQPKQIVLVAGIASVRAARENPTLAFAVNTGGAATLLHAATKRAPRSHLTLVSTAASQRPDTIYSASKAAAEYLFAAHCRQTTQPVAIARLHNQLGPGLSREHAPGEFAQVIVDAEDASHDQVTLHVGNPAAQRDYLDVRDTARALTEVTEAGLTGTFEICRGEQTPLSELINLLSKGTDLPVRMDVTDGRAHRVGADSQTGDPARLRAATGWQPEISLEESLLALLASLRV